MTLNPYQGLKHQRSMIRAAKPVFATMTLNPYQGLKLMGIFSGKTDRGYRRDNDTESLSGIETRNSDILRELATGQKATMTLNPYQGLKHESSVNP
jgi:hypothetical protein